MESAYGRCQWALCSAAALLFIVGCSGSTASSPKIKKYTGDTVPISGTVKLDGEPVSGATVAFTFDGKPPEGFVSAGAITDSTGKYVLRSGDKTGAPPGRYKITVSKFATPDGKPFKEDLEKGLDLEQARMSGVVRESIPAKYSDPSKTELVREITADQKDPVDLDLKSK